MSKLSRREFNQTAVGATAAAAFSGKGVKDTEAPLIFDPEDRCKTIVAHLRDVANKIEIGEIDPASVNLSNEVFLDRNEKKTQQSGCVHWDVTGHRAELLTYTLRSKSTNGA